MATLQEQIDDLRRQISNLQSNIASRAKRTDVNTINEDISAAQGVLEAQIEAYELCIEELQNGLLAAKNLLSTHTH